MALALALSPFAQQTAELVSSGAYEAAAGSCYAIFRCLANTCKEHEDWYAGFTGYGDTYTKLAIFTEAVVELYCHIHQKPDYNSAVATFCNNIANDLPIQVNDPNVDMELLYIDDLVDEMICALQGKEHHCEFDGVETVLTPDGRYCAAPVTHHVKLGEIVELLHEFAEQPQTLMVPEIPAGSFAKKLYSTYLSYLPEDKVAFPLKMNVDDRGSFTELVHTHNAGQVSINISRPGITKGQHWHNTKFEQFIVVKGHGLIQQRNLNDPEGRILGWEVDGDHIQAVHMLPGYTHNIINLSDTEDLVMVMYCNEVFNPHRPDTFFLEV